MPSLQTLPDEILLRIIAHIPSHSDVAALALQSQRFHDCCDLPNRRKYRRIKLRSAKEIERGLDMLLSILGKPRLGAYVLYLELDRSPSYAYGNTYELQPPQRSIAPRDLERLKEAIQRAGFTIAEGELMVNMLQQDPHTMRWGDKRMIFLPQSLAALLVSVSPNLESLAFCPLGYKMSKLLRFQAEERGEITEQPPHMFRMLLDRANASQADMPLLRNLRTVRFLPDRDSHWADERFYQEYDLYGSLNLVRRLPAVESVRFDAIVDGQNRSVRLPPRSANYSKIAICNSILDYHHHVNIIESAKLLKEFTFTVGGRGSSDGSSRILNPDHIFKSLFLHRDTLESLDLNMEAEVEVRPFFDSDFPAYWLNYDNDDDDFSKQEYEFEWVDELGGQESNRREDPLEPPPPRCSLRSFPKLKQLSLGICHLYYYARGLGDDRIDDESFSLVDHLPPNLESLRIYGYEKGMSPVEGFPEFQFDDHLAKLREEKDEKLPSLKFIDGIEEGIPNATTVDNPDDDEDLLWKPEEEDDWTEYEY